MTELVHFHPMASMAGEFIDPEARNGISYHSFLGLKAQAGNFSKTLQELHKIEPGTTVRDNFGAIYFAESSLRELLDNNVLPPQVCQEKCRVLVDLLANFMALSMKDEEPRTDALTDWEVSSIRNALRDFETVLESEYRTKPVFALSKKALYSLEQLVFRGDELVSEAVHALIPGMREDLKDAGRCIAFEVPTAAAFHLFRAAEAAVEAYIFSLRRIPVTDIEKKYGLGGYANILRGQRVDDRVVAALEQLTKLHRNPTIHPNIRVSNEEVLATLGMVGSLIRIVGIDLQRRINTPDTPLEELLPMLTMPLSQVALPPPEPGLSHPVSRRAQRKAKKHVEDAV